MASNTAINQASPVNWAHPLNRGLAGWWMVMPGTHSGSRLTDLTDPGPSGNHGTFVNMDNSDWVGSSRPGGWGELDFVNGASQLITPGIPASLQLESGPITISVWGFDRAGSNSIITTGASRGSNSARGFDLFDTGSQFRFHGLDGAVMFAVDTTTRPTLNTWHLFTATWDGTTSTNGAKLYVDAILAAEATSGNTSVNTGFDWNIGGEGDNDWDGRLDDVRIYNRVLSAGEVQQLYQLSQQGYPGVLNRLSRPLLVAAVAAIGIRNPMAGPMTLRNPLGDG